jgi:hypothetical protein
MMTSRAMKPAGRHGRSERLEESKDLERLLFAPAGRRKLPGQRALDRVLARLSAEELFWFCETRAAGPIYVLPTLELVRGLAGMIRELTRPGSTVLEVAAGDGFLTQSLKRLEPSLRWQACDSGAWLNPHARMSPGERREQLGNIRGLQLGPEVQRAEAVAAIRAFRPAVVIASWLPPGKLFERILRAPCRFVIEIGAGGGVTGQGEWGWRFAHDFAPASVEKLARSRLDAGGDRRTQITIYRGRLHPEFREERPRPGDWLAQFKPAR